jgi:hypothetical protein
MLLVEKVREDINKRDEKMRNDLVCRAGKWENYYDKNHF